MKVRIERDQELQERDFRPLGELRSIRREREEERLQKILSQAGVTSRRQSNPDPISAPGSEGC